MKKTAKMVDERITKETNALTANACWLMLILQSGVLGAKVMMGLSVMLCLLDIAVLTVSFAGITILRCRKGLWGRKDEAMTEIEQEGLAKIFMVLFWMLIVGEFLLFNMDEAHMGVYALYLLIWGIPALYVMIMGFRSGCYVWGGKKAEENGKMRLLKGTIMGAAFFGIVMGGPACIKDGAFNPAGLLQVAAMGSLWGLLFYWLFAGWMKLGGRQADKNVADAEGVDDEA